jgi:hypothetical protein
MSRTPDYYTSVLASGGKISGQLRNKDQSIPNLTGSIVTFLMRQPGGEVYLIEALATVTVPLEGRWEYAWQEGDRDTPGDHKVNLLVEFPDGHEDVYPDPGYVLVRISSDD